MTSSPSSSKPRNVRQSLSVWEPGAYLWAPFSTHFKGGVASLLPFGIIFFLAQPIGDAMATLTLFGYTFGPVAVAITGTLWALMSIGLLHLVRYRDHLGLHLGVYALGGAVSLLLVAMVWLTFTQGLRTGTYDPTGAGSFTQVIVGAGPVGALGAMVGRWAINKTIYWHRTIVRNPLPDVFGFVEGKRDKDDFKKM